MGEVGGSRVGRVRGRYLWLDHVFRAAKSYGDHYGNYYAAAITYFSILSLVPVLMLASAIASTVLAGDDALQARVHTEIGERVPGALGDSVNKVVQGAIDARGAVGVIGLVIALYSGVGWMTHLRNALTEQWGLERPKLPLVSTAAKDLLALLGLGAALVASLAASAADGAVSGMLDRYDWAEALVTVAGVLVALTVNWLMFLWVIAWLPRHPVSRRVAVRGALLAAVGFEVLKQLAGILLTRTAHSPTGSVFGPVIGLLVFANLTARFLLFATAWTATSPPSTPPDDPVQ